MTKGKLMAATLPITGSIEGNQLTLKMDLDQPGKLSGRGRMFIQFSTPRFVTLDCDGEAILVKVCVGQRTR